MPSLLASFGLDANSFHHELARAQGAAKHVGGEIKSSLGDFARSTLMGFGAAAGVVGMADIVRSTIETAEHIRELSKEFRVSTDTIQIWEKGAHHAGMSAEDVGNAMNRLKKSREAAIEKRDPGAFSSFGITLDDLNNQALSIEQIRDRMSGQRMTDDKDVAGMELMGKSGARILSAMEEIHNLGPVKLIDASDIENLHEAEETLRELKRQMTIATARTVTATEDVGSRMSRGARGLAKFMSGELSWNEARRFGLKEQNAKEDAAATVPAPTRDLKGRPIKNQTPETRPAGESTALERKRIAELKKYELEVEKKREELADKIYQNQLRGMTHLQRQVELKKEIAKYEEKAAVASALGQEALSIDEQLKAEKLRGEMDVSHKAEKIDFNAAQKAGAYTALPGGMGTTHAQKTERHTEKIANDLEKLLVICKGYTGRQPRLMTGMDIGGDF